MNRRGFLSAIAVLAAPTLPLLGQIPRNPTIVYGPVEWMINPNPSATFSRHVARMMGHDQATGKAAYAAVCVIREVYERRMLFVADDLKDAIRLRLTRARA
jgi:hypothetical protein